MENAGRIERKIVVRRKTHIRPRVNAARLTAQVPGLREDIQSGSLTLTQLSTAAQGFRQKENLGKKLSLEEKAGVLSALKNKGSFESQQITAKLLELPVVKQEKIKPQADESVRLEMTLSKEEGELVQRAREILGHVSPGMSWKELFVFMARDLIKRKDPAREVRARAKGSRQDQGQGRDEKQIQNKRQILNKDEDQNPNRNRRQEQGGGSGSLVKSGLNSGNALFDDTTKSTLGSPEDASARLVLSSDPRSRALAEDLAPSPVIIPTPVKTPTLEQRSTATLARWVKLSSPTPGAQILGGKLQGSELPRSELVEAELLGAERLGVELSGSELSESGQNGAEVPVAELPRVELSGAGEIQLSFEAATKATTASTLPSLSVAAALRRLVFRRDQRCQWLDPITGRKCGSRHLLELDHIQPRWAGGLDEPSNLRLLCRSHNGLKYRLEARIRARSARTESL